MFRTRILWAHPNLIWYFAAQYIVKVLAEYILSSPKISNYCHGFRKTGSKEIFALPVFAGPSLRTSCSYFNSRENYNSIWIPLTISPPFDFVEHRMLILGFHKIYLINIFTISYVLIYQITMRSQCFRAEPRNIEPVPLCKKLAQ